MRGVSPETVMALAVLDAERNEKPLEIEDISAFFVELQHKGLGFEDIALRMVPGGVYSEDVEAFVGRLLDAGYAKQRSPIQFEREGYEVCQSIISRAESANKPALEAIASALQLSYR